jgi:hypothetical protein
LKEGKTAQAEEVLKKTLHLAGTHDRAYRMLENLKKEDAAKGRLESPQQFSYHPVTVNNYRKIKEILDKRRIPLVCVQTPTASVAPLKNMFAGQYGILFVDNEKVFREAIERGSYQEYLIDFDDHCTDKGYRLLAENVANTILREYFKK